MTKLKGAQKKYLKSLAHKLKPVVFIGQKGMTETLSTAIDQALNDHELIKIRFVDFKEKEKKEAMARQIEKQTGQKIID